MSTRKLLRPTVLKRPMALALVSLRRGACTGKTEYNYPDQKPGQKDRPDGQQQAI